MSKKQQILTTTLTSIDKSAGEQGPPNRIAPQSDFPSSFLTPSTTQVKSENQTPNATQSVSFDTHRTSTESLSRMSVPSNNQNLITQVETNGSHTDSKHIKIEQTSPNNETKIQVRRKKNIYES